MNEFYRNDSTKGNQWKALAASETVERFLDYQAANRGPFRAT